MIEIAHAHPDPAESSPPVRPRSVQAIDPHDPDADAGDAIIEIGVPGRYVDASFDRMVVSPSTLRMRDAATRALDHDRNCGLIGPNGCGKTEASVATLRERARRQIAAGRPWSAVLNARFVVVPELIDELREREGVRGTPNPLPKLREVALLVLDDLGAERPTDYALDRLFVLVNGRSNEMLPTVWTSNYTNDQLADRGYGSIISRLVEDAEIVYVDGADFRLRGRG